MGERPDGTSPIIVFYSYAHEDESLRNELEKHLSLLQRRGVITTWHDRKIVPGTDWADAIDSHLSEAAIILLLISPDFMASDYCYGNEMQFALKRHEQGLAHVIPILLRPVDCQDAPFSHLQYLPTNNRPVTLWESRDEAFLNVVKGIRDAVAQMRSPVRGQNTSRSASPTSHQNRLSLLRGVRTRWIQGVLEQSLHHVALITLGLHEQPDALENPWRLIVQETEQQPARPLPAGTPITQVYDEADGALLILGEPGSGKTTLLLQLACELLDRADQDETHRMPVVFNLSSWAVKQQPLTDWLAEELDLRYQVPLQLAKDWVSTDRILPLLDGLDEVAPSHRAACLKEINTYIDKHRLDPPVVCSRSEDYRSLSARIWLHNAVTIQPLTTQQIDEYLNSAGEQLDALHTVLHRDTVLLNLATTPLMLSILALTYHGKTVAELPTTGSPDARRQQIFAAYVQSMFMRRGGAVPYTQQRSVGWLKWLASRMARYSQTEFYLESMQPDWLWTKLRRRCYEWTVGRPLLYIMWALLHAVYSGLLAVLVVILVSTVAVGISKETLGALLGIFPGGVLISLVSGILYGWRKGLYTAAVGIPMGALVGALISRVISGLDRSTMGLIVGLVTGGMIGLLASIISGKGGSGISTVPKFDWSWKAVQLGFKRENKHLQVASVLGGVSSILVGAVVTLEKGVFSGLGMGGVMLLAGLLLFVLYSGVQSKSLPKEKQVVPNQRIWLSARKGLYFCLAVGSCAFTGTWLIISSVAGSAMGLTCGLVAGVLSGIAIGWVSDWDACVRHFVLRVLLWQAGFIPRNYTRFLNYAVDRIFLRKTGGGYIFIHRQLLEYFALLATPEIGIEYIEKVNPDTKDATIYHNQGLIFAEFSNYDQAIKHYTRAIDLDPKEVSVYRDRGLAYARRKDYQQAIADYISAIDLDSKNAWTYRQRGIAYRELEDYEKAITDFTQAIRLEPERELTYRYRGWSYHSNKESEKALADFSQAIKLAPQGAWCYAERGQFFTELEDYEKARADLSTAIELAPQEAEFYRDRGFAYTKLKEYQSAIEDYNRAIELDPNAATLYNCRGNAYYALKEYGRALEDYTRAIELDPKQAWVYSNRGNAYSELKEYQKAIADFDRAIELDPKQAWTYDYRGDAYYALEKYERALEDYTRALELDSGIAGYYMDRGYAYYRLKEYERAIEDYTRAIELDPKQAWVYSNRGDAYSELKEYQKAIADFDRAIELDPKFAKAYARRGSTYVDLNEYLRAIEDYNRATELVPTYESAYFQRGYVYLWLKDLQQAKADFTRCLELDASRVQTHLMDTWVGMCQERPDMEMVQRLEEIITATPDTQRYGTRVCRGVSLWGQGSFEQALIEVEQSISLDPAIEAAYFWKGVICASLRRDEEAIAAIARALELKLPPVLLTPLRWLDKDRQDFCEKHVEPLLTRYNVLNHQETGE